MDKYDDVVASFSDSVFEFLEHAEASPENSSNFSGDTQDDYDDDDDDDGGAGGENESFFTVEENMAFWEEQEQFLQATLCRTTSIETEVRHATKDALRELNGSDVVCICRQPVVAKSCRNCLQREICNRLLNLGHNCAICKSKWRSSSEVPSGQHTYLEVTDKSNAKRGEVKVVIELNFRGEFEMARANKEYNRLISRLPEVFVGKAERLRASVEMMCSAAKKCMKEKKMHLGPWRKRRYMQAKWLGTCDGDRSKPLPMACSTHPPRPKASLLTCDLLENIPAMHCTVVEVV